MAETDLWFGTLSATVRVEDLPASRQVVAIERQANGDWRVCGQAMSNSEGIATLPITGLPTSRIYAIAIDEWGKPFAPGMPVAYGDVIRPTQFLGWMYQVTAPGVLPTTEPEWWNGMAGIPQPVGTAMMQAIRHYQPIAHGPVSDIEWVEQEFDPHWGNVVALLHFDGDLVDETGRVWVAEGATPYVPGVFSDAVTLETGLLSTSSSLDFVLDGDFTIECFINLRKRAGVRALLSSGVNGWNPGSVYLVFTNQGRLEIGSYSHGTMFLGDHIFPENKWFYLTMVRKDGVCLVYEDGILVESGAASSPLDFSTQGTLIGTHGRQPNSRLTGDIDELRITKGVARYTENFTPPTAPFPNVGPPL